MLSAWRATFKMGAEAHRNVYLSLAVLRPDLPPAKKGFEADIVGVLGIVADFDDPEAAHWAHRLPLPPDYVLETSAGRFQAFYILDKPYPVEEAKPIEVDPVCETAGAAS
jgi:hypothetical protein